MSSVALAPRTTNGTPIINRLSKSTRSRSSASAESRQTRPTARQQAGASAARWATAYVGLAVGLSCGLNAYANCRHAPEELLSEILAGVLGAVIPVLVLILGKVASLAWKRGRQWLAGIVGGIGCAVLGLSVIHCTDAIAVLTGSEHVLALLLAVGIDCGLVACEVTATVAE